MDLIDQPIKSFLFGNITGLGITLTLLKIPPVSRSMWFATEGLQSNFKISMAAINYFGQKGGSRQSSVKYIILNVMEGINNQGL